MRKQNICLGVAFAMLLLLVVCSLVWSQEGEECLPAVPDGSEIILGDDFPPLFTLKWYPDSAGMYRMFYTLPDTAVAFLEREEDIFFKCDPCSICQKWVKETFSCDTLSKIIFVFQSACPDGGE